MNPNLPVTRYTKISVTYHNIDIGLNYLVNHLPDWNESGELLPLALLDDFFSLRNSIYKDIVEYDQKQKSEKEPNKVILLTQRNYNRHISANNIIGNLWQRTLRSDNKKAH